MKAARAIVQEHIARIAKERFGYAHAAVWSGTAVVPAVGHEAALRGLVNALASYADAHRARYGSDIGSDAVLGDSWLEVARGTIGLLNGESGRLDCGTIDATIRDIAAEHGFDEKERDSL